MTLIELLVVISILGILAATLLPTLSRVKGKTQIQRTRLEIDELVSAITEYEALYSRYPVSDEAVKAAAAQGEDMTYGGADEVTHIWMAGPAYLTNNCEVMAVLLDLECYGDGAPTINQGHRKNPRREILFHATMRGGTNATPGVGMDGVYRDPWKSPYVITLDLNRDGRARDVFYCRPGVSEDPKTPTRGLNGLARIADAKGNAVFEATGPIMVWSAGPDRQLDSKEKADQGVNRDNLLSWKR